jgi:hypothetical protein
MPGTIDDFKGYFARHREKGDPIDLREVEQYHKRFVSKKAEDGDFDYQTYHQSVMECLDKLPDDEFQQEARFAVSRATPEQRQGLLERLLNELERAAGGKADIANLDLSSRDPSKMSLDDAARLMNYARRKHPELLAKIVEERPSFLKHLVDPIVVCALANTAERLRA